MQTDKHERIQQLTESALTQLNDALTAGKSDALKRYLGTMAKFHRYSFRNQLLIAMQRPDATMVAGFTTWKTKFNRWVKKGETGIVIFAPVIRKVSRQGTAATQPQHGDDATALVNVKAAYVFDVSQTDGEPLPEFAAVSGDPSEYAAKLDRHIGTFGIKLEYASNLEGADGRSSGGVITVLDSLPPIASFHVKLHELAHELLHKGERRGQTTRTVRETEAEAVAFVVMQALGMDCGTHSSDYIQLYRGDVETLSESLSFIRKVASDLIETLSASESGEQLTTLSATG